MKVPQGSVKGGFGDVAGVDIDQGVRSLASAVGRVQARVGAGESEHRLSPGGSSPRTRAAAARGCRAPDSSSSLSGPRSPWAAERLCCVTLAGCQSRKAGMEKTQSRYNRATQMDMHVT